jgi:hypothetical protein
MRLGGEPLEVAGSIVRRERLGDVVARLRSPAEPLPGLLVAVLPGRVPGLFLDNRSGRTIVVHGPDGEPFLRFLPDGVEANVRSPAWRRSAGSGATAPSAPAEPSGSPEWAPVAAVPRFGWLEPRMAASPSPAQLRELAAAGQPARLIEWEVPLGVDGEPTVIQGETTFRPVSSLAGDPDLALGETGGRGEGDVSPLAGLSVPGAALLGAVLLAAGLVVANRFRRRSRGG